jgi:hypothetical protein
MPESAVKAAGSGMEVVCRVDQSRATCSAKGGGVPIVAMAACFTMGHNRKDEDATRHWQSSAR